MNTAVVIPVEARSSKSKVGDRNLNYPLVFNPASNIFDDDECQSNNRVASVAAFVRAEWDSAGIGAPSR
jgi:hypothetical protein